MPDKTMTQAEIDSYYEFDYLAALMQQPPAPTHAIITVRPVGR